jgi:hypothetical protein
MASEGSGDEISLDALLIALEHATEAGVISLQVTEVAALAQTRASEELFLAMAEWRTDEGRIKAASDAARRAGVSAAELASNRSALLEMFVKRLRAAETAIEANLSAHAMEELAMAIHTGHKHGHVSEELHVASETYANVLKRKFTGNDIAFVVHAVSFAGYASAHVPAHLGLWPEAVETLQETASMSENTTELLPHFVNAVSLCKRARFPRTQEFLVVESKARMCAAAQLRETLAKEQLRGNASLDLAEILPALARAREMGVPASELAPAETLAQTRAAMELKLAISAHRSDEGRISLAFEDARSAGVPEKDLDAKRSELQTLFADRLRAAKANCESNRTMEAVEELASTIHTGQKLAYAHEEIVVASKVFEKSLLGPFTEADVDFVERAFELSDLARAVFPEKLRGWLKARGRSV